MALTVAPDALKLAHARVKASPDVVALVAGRVHANELPRAGAVFPCVRLLTVTTSELVEYDGWSFGPERIQVDCWGEQAWSFEQARQLARTVRSVLSTLPGVYTEGAVTRVELVAGLSSFTDPDNGKAGYRFDVAVYTHPRQH